MTVGDAIRVLLPTDALWQGVVFGLEPSFVINAVQDEFARNSPFFADAPPSVAIVAWSGIWVVLVLSSRSTSSAAASCERDANCLSSGTAPAATRRAWRRSSRGFVRAG